MIKLTRQAKRLRLVIMLGLSVPVSAFAADFTVTTHLDSGAGSLRAAITAVNAAGAGSHTITFDPELDPIALGASLPMIIGTDQSIRIFGSGSTIDGQNSSRLFFVADGTVSIQDLTLQNGLADGGEGGDGAGGGGGGAGAGGGLFVNSGARVSLQGVNFAGNAAAGGNGGNASTGGGGGGGGGLGGNGGTVLNISDAAGGAGGGGWGGDGGDVEAGKEGGGGGGGVIGSGGNATTPSGASGGGFNDGGDSSSSAADETDGSDGATGEGGQGGGSRSDYIAGSGGDGGLFGGGGGGGMAEGDDVAPVSGGAGGGGGKFGGGGGGGGIANAEPTDSSGAGGNAGDFGGGGGGGASDGGLVGPSGDGGFMGGGAGAARNGASGSSGSGGFGAGDGGANGFGGHGGDALGGAIFVRSGGSLTIIDSSIAGSTLTAGLGSTNGTTNGAGIYLHDGVDLTINVTEGQTQTIADVISDDQNTNQTSSAGSLVVAGVGILNLSASNTYSGGTTLNYAKVGVYNNVSLGTGAVTTSGVNTILKQTVSDLTLSNDMNWNGPVTIGGEVDGTMTFDGDINVQSPTILIVERDLTITSDLNFTDPTSFFAMETGTDAELELLGGSNRTGQTNVFPITVRIAQADAFGSGLIQFFGDNALAVNSDLTIGNAVNFGNSLTFYDHSTNVATLSGALTLTEAETTLAGRANLTGNVGASAVGNSLRFADGSNFSLTGNNTYTGGTVVGENVNLSVGHQNAFGTGPVSLDAGELTLTTSTNGLTIANDFSIGSLNQIFFIGDLPALSIVDATNLTLSGDIEGSGALELNNSTVTLLGTNTHMGQTTFLNGAYSIAGDESLGFGSGDVTIADSALQFLESTESDRLYELSGDVIFQAAAGAEVTLNGTVRSEESLTIEGPGTINMAGLSGFQSVTVNGGVLKANNSISADLTVGTDGTLGGSGSITGDVINNGTLAVGNSIGALTQTGNYTQNGGAFEVEIASGGNTPGVHNDVLNVTGNATINGGDVIVTSAAGTYTAGTQYTFLSATSLAGTFDLISDDLAFFDAELGYTANSAYFTLIKSQADFASIAVTGNQASIAAYINAIASGASGDTSDLIDQFTLMSHGQVQNGLNQLTGDLYGSGIQVGIHGTTQLLGMIAAQLRDGMALGRGAGSSGSYGMSSKAPSSDIQLVNYESSACDSYNAGTGRRAEQWRGWVLGYGLGGFASSDGNAMGIDYGIGGTSFGALRFIDPNTQIGFFGGYVGSNVSTRGASQSVASDGANLGALFTHGSDAGYLLGIGGFEFNGIESNRDLVIGGLSTRARGETDAWQGFTYGETGTNVSLSRHSVLQPFAGLQYIYSQQDEFTETGAGAANLVVSGVDTHSLRSHVGARWQLLTLLERGYAITPELRGSWLHEFLDTSSIVNAQLAGAGGAGFAASGLDLGRDWAIVGGGLSVRPSDCWELRADYNSQFNDRTVMHIGSGSVAYTW